MSCSLTSLVSPTLKQLEAWWSWASPLAGALLQQTRTIPIVFATVGDPIDSGVVASQSP
jgi:ABC-type uncharacterized transport system substrate-binding protein